jgi:hypothetical protein
VGGVTLVYDEEKQGVRVVPNKLNTQSNSTGALSTQAGDSGMLRTQANSSKASEELPDSGTLEIDGYTVNYEIAYYDDAGKKLDSAPTLKVTEKPQAAGYLRQHDLTIPTRGDYEKVRQARGRLAGVDFHVVLRTLAGTRFLLYSPPNSSTVSVEDQFGQDSKQTVKVSLQSMSSMIRLT